VIELPFRWRPRLGVVLLAVNLLVLALPLAGILAVRQYENELVRSTEAQLLVQGATCGRRSAGRTPPRPPSRVPPRPLPRPTRSSPRSISAA